MKTTLKKALRIAYSILFIPTLLCFIYDLVLELAGYSFVNDLLASAQIPLSAQQLAYISYGVGVLWLLCLGGILVLNQKEQKAAEETAEKARIANNFDPNCTDTPLRQADRDVKNRVFVEKTVDAYRICYRRVGKRHELIVNGEVYAEITTGWEQNHELKTHVNGHEIRAGYNKIGYNYLIFDGETVVKNLRVFF